MRVLHWRFGLGLFWLAMAGGLFLRDELFPPELLARYQGRNLTFGAWLALLLAGWNLARWYQTESDRARRAVACREPLRPRPEAGTDYEYNPEFDFQKMDREAGGDSPGRNGTGP